MRTKLAKYLEVYGVRVQKSVFECLLTEGDYQTCLAGLAQYTTKEDSIRAYPITKENYRNKHVLGIQYDYHPDEDTIV